MQSTIPRSTVASTAANAGQAPGRSRRHTVPGLNLNRLAMAPSTAFRSAPAEEAPSRSAEDVVSSLILPGDIIFVEGDGHLQTLGANGGFMGHVLLALGSPQRVDSGSDLALALAEAWPSDANVWRVRTMESTRAESGLHHAEMLLHVDSATNLLHLVGELSMDHMALSKTDSEVVQVWQSPPSLRTSVQLELVDTVLQDMGALEAEWSLATAARAILLSGERCGDSIRRSAVLREAKSCWQSKPICTSVVIVFWQRYLCKLAERTQTSAGAAELIKAWMPLKADRTLPGTLQSVLRECGWVIVAQIGSNS